MADAGHGHGGGEKKEEEKKKWIYIGIAILILLAILNTPGGLLGLFHGQGNSYGPPRIYGGYHPYPPPAPGPEPSTYLPPPPAPEIPSHYVGDPIPGQVVHVQHPPPKVPGKVPYRCDVATGHHADPGNGWCVPNN